MSILNLCTAFAIAGCIDLTATDSDDHMDIITASSATLTSPDMHSSKLDASTSGVSSDRVLRTRSKTSKSAPDHLTTRRKRALSISATEAEKAKLGQKKTKLEDKRAVSGRLWLYIIAKCALTSFTSSPLLRMRQRYLLRPPEDAGWIVTVIFSSLCSHLEAPYSRTSPQTMRRMFRNMSSTNSPNL